MVFKEPIYKLLAMIRDKPYYKRPHPMGGDLRKRNQWWKCAYHKEKGHMIESCRALKSFSDQLVEARHLKEFVDQEKTKAEETEVRPNSRFDRDRGEADNALEEDLPHQDYSHDGGPHDLEL